MTKPPVADPDSGDIRVMSAKCATCILNPADRRIPLSPERIREFIAQARDAEGHVICHSTLDREAGAAMCRGYTDAYGLPEEAILLVAAGYGQLVEIDPDTLKEP